MQHFSKVYERAALSHSIRHSRTSILACTMPRLSRSAEVLLPEYVGLMSFPMSSMTARSCAYLLCGSCCGRGGAAIAAWLCSICIPGGTIAGDGITLAGDAELPEGPAVGGGVLRTSSVTDLGVPGLLTRGVPGLLTCGVPRPELEDSSSAALQMWNHQKNNNTNSVSIYFY